MMLGKMTEEVMFGFNDKKKEDEKKKREREAAACRQRAEDKDGCFATSMAVAMATDSTLLGYAAGGNLMGAMVGASIAESSSLSVSTSDSSGSSSYDSSTSCDSGSSITLANKIITCHTPAAYWTHGCWK
jgi:hypothetical protein